MKRLIRLLCVAAMVAATVLAVPTAASAAEPLDNQFPWAEQLSPGVIKTSTISAAGDEDWYYFYVYERCDVSFTFSATGTGWRRASLSQYFASDLDFIQGIENGANLQLDPGLYYVRVYDTWDGIGGYSLKVAGSRVTTNWAAFGSVAPWYIARRAVTVPERLESSDDQVGRTQAYNPLTGFLVYRSYIQSDGDADWYRFNVTSADDVTIGFSNFNVRGRLYYGSGLEYVTTINTENHTTLRLQPGFYYLKVEPYWGGSYSSTEPYFFSVQGRRVVANPYATLTVPTATTVTPRVGQAFTAAGTISPKHQVGTYCMTVSAERYESGRWVVRKNVQAPIVSATTASSTYQVAMSLPYAGTWRIRAMHRDLGHFQSVSGYRTITVK